MAMGTVAGPVRPAGMDQLPLPPHGATTFPGLRLDAYAEELPGPEGSAPRPFGAVLEAWRAKLRSGGILDPFGEAPSDEVDRQALDAVLAEGSPEASGLVNGAIEEFAHELADAVRQVLTLPGWDTVQRLLVGGGFHTCRLGEAVVGRAATLLRNAGLSLPVMPVRHDPPEAVLIGAAHLVPRTILAAADGVLTAELSGHVFRAGVVLPRLGVSPVMNQAGVWRLAEWRRAEAPEADRSAALGRLAALLSDLAGAAAGAGLSLAPVVAVACPGEIAPDGRILRGADELPGEWEGVHFRLHDSLSRRLPKAGQQAPAVLVHNATVALGLSESAFQGDVKHWAAVTIGERAGTARFTRVPLSEA